jgi:Protein of unknown function (DUF2510)/Domain of unknown function (DUF4352)
MGAPNAPAGWYPDPSGAPGQRYFDGQQWTSHAPPPPKQSHTGLWVGLSVLAAVVLFFGGCTALMVVGMNKADDPGSVTGAEVSIGQHVSDGKFSFVVSDVSTPEHWIGDPRPRGRWVIATMTVTNTSDQPQSFFVQNQKLIDTAGREYAADSMAAI